MQLKPILILMMFTIAQHGMSQNAAIITYKDGKITSPSEIPYGQIILLQGESVAEYDFVEVECIFNSNTRTYKAQRETKTKWSAQIGPFPIRADLILTIKENRLLSKTEKQNILSRLDKLIKQLKTTGSFDTIELKNKVYATLGELDYRNKEGIPIDSVFWKSISLPLLNGLNEGKKLDSTNLVKVLLKHADAPLTKSYLSNKEKIQSLLSSKADSLRKTIKAITGLDTSVVKSLQEEYKKRFAKYSQALTEFEKIASDLFSTTTISESYRTAIDVSGIQAYVGVDLGLLNFDNKTSFFVTLYPYLVKTDPERDYKFNCKTIGHFISPAFGIGIGNDIDGIKPVYFVGIGSRLNKVARIAVGATYYKPQDRTDYQWNFGFSASISINYVADLLRLITAAQSQIKQ